MFFSPTFKNCKKKRKEEQHPPTKTSKWRWLFWNPRKWGGGLLELWRVITQKPGGFLAFLGDDAKCAERIGTEEPRMFLANEMCLGTMHLARHRRGKSSPLKLWRFFGRNFRLPSLEKSISVCLETSLPETKTAKNPGPSKKMVKKMIGAGSDPFANPFVWVGIGSYFERVSFD